MLAHAASLTEMVLEPAATSHYASPCLSSHHLDSVTVPSNHCNMFGAKHHSFLLLCCYHQRCVDVLQLHLLVLMPSIPLTYTHRPCLLSPLASVPQPQDLSLAGSGVTRSTPALSSAGVRKVQQWSRRESTMETSSNREGNVSAYATANPSVKKHGKCIISFHWLVTPKTQGLQEGVLNA